MEPNSNTIATCCEHVRSELIALRWKMECDHDVNMERLADLLEQLPAPEPATDDGRHAGSRRDTGGGSGSDALL